MCFQEGKMSWTVADAVDYKGFPADRSKTGGWVPAALILGKFIPNLLHFSCILTYSNMHVVHTWYMDLWSIGFTDSGSSNHHVLYTNKHS